MAPGTTPSAVASAVYVLNLLAVISGTVTSSRPVKNAHVYLFAANTTGYGQASVSLMDAVIAGKRPETNQRTSLGCNIKWRE